MRHSSAIRLVISAILLVAGFGIISDGSPTRGALAQSLASWFDMNERQCRQASVAVGSACPVGCAARPVGSAQDRSAPTECHSHLWIATCGRACAPKNGFARNADGGLIDARRLVVTLRTDPDAALERELAAIGVTLSPRFDGLDRYDAEIKNGTIQKIKKRLTALPQVASAEYVLR